MCHEECSKCSEIWHHCQSLTDRSLRDKKIGGLQASVHLASGVARIERMDFYSRFFTESGTFACCNARAMRKGMDNLDSLRGIPHDD